MATVTARLITVLAVLAAVAGCGAGGDTPKRAVDPLDEALRFFPADAEAVILLRADKTSFDTLAQVAHQLSPTLSPVPDVTIPLRAVADPGDVAELTTAGEGSGPRIAVGAETARELFGNAGLAVLVTERSEALEQLLEDAVGAERIEPDGEFHEARLYRGPGSGIAERDGVLLIGADRAAVAQALEIRDGDSDGHLDDRAAEDTIDELPQSAPLLAFLDTQAMAADDSVPAGLDAAPWIDRLRQAAVAARPAPRGVALHVFGDGDGTNLEGAIDDASLERLPPPVDVAGGVSVAGDEMRAVLLLKR